MSLVNDSARGGRQPRTRLSVPAIVAMLSVLTSCGARRCEVEDELPASRADWAIPKASGAKSLAPPDAAEPVSGLKQGTEELT